ncbi:EamA family transporter [Spirochaeta dissipatitropha]
MGILMAALAAVFYGSADFAGGLATKRNSVSSVLVTSQVVGLVIAVIAAPLLGSTQVSAADLLWGAAAGLSGAVGLAYLYKGIAHGIVAIAAPKAAVVGAALPVVGGVLLGQMPEASAWAGIIISIIAIFLLSWEKIDHSSRKLVHLSLKYGLIAGTAFGGFSILISQTSDTSGFWPLVSSRAVSVAVVFAMTVLNGRKVRLARESLAAVSVAGSMDILANIFFLIAVRLTLLPIVAVVSGFAPAPTVLLGHFILHEKLGWNRVLGLAAALLGIVLLSL